MLNENIQRPPFLQMMLRSFLEPKNLRVSWPQREHQPMFLETMQQLSTVMLDADVNLFDCRFSK